MAGGGDCKYIDDPRLAASKHLLHRSSFSPDTGLDQSHLGWCPDPALSLAQFRTSSDNRHSSSDEKSHRFIGTFIHDNLRQEFGMTDDSSFERE